MNNYILIIFILILLSSIFAILSVNPVQSVLYLILVFLQAAMLFMFLGAEFISLLILIVYVGAISTLFLFIIMMLNLRIVEAHSTFFNYLPVGSFIGLFFFFELISFICNDFGFFAADAKICLFVNFK
jgi:NADH-quinone oxidoreductase subunit J